MHSSDLWAGCRVYVAVLDMSWHALLVLHSEIEALPRVLHIHRSTHLHFSIDSTVSSTLGLPTLIIALSAHDTNILSRRKDSPGQRLDLCDRRATAAIGKASRIPKLYRKQQEVSRARLVKTDHTRDQRQSHARMEETLSGIEISPVLPEPFGGAKGLMAPLVEVSDVDCKRCEPTNPWPICMPAHLAA